ncbi:MAG: TRAP transporter large permease subunit, partial [Aestuariivirgaceae bacterium]
MDPITVGYLSVIALFVCLAIGVPVAVAMGGVGIVGMYLAVGELFVTGQLRSLPFATVNEYGLAVLPMFVLMGVLAETSGITAQVF